METKEAVHNSLKLKLEEAVTKLEALEKSLQVTSHEKNMTMGKAN